MAETYDLVRSPDYETSGTWYVLVDGKRVGSVRPSWDGVSTKRWKAYSNVQQLTGGLRADRRGTYRTRTDAAVEVLLRPPAGGYAAAVKAKQFRKRCRNCLSYFFFLAM